MSDWDTIGTATAAEGPLAWDSGDAAATATTGDDFRRGSFFSSTRHGFDGIAPEHVSKYEGGDDEACRKQVHSSHSISSFQADSRCSCGQIGHFKRDCTEPPQNTGECYNCGAMGHTKATCTEPPKNSGECYNCGETGHNKAECANPAVERPFAGECRSCGEMGHRSSECTMSSCKKCGEMGHTSSKCANAYRIYPEGTEDMEPDPAWEQLIDADGDGDVDDFKKAFFAYAKACPDLTFPMLEISFREMSFKTFIIAKEPIVSDVHTNVDLQGLADRKYVISFQHTQTPRRKIGSQNWPKTPEENLERLENAGFVLDRMVVKCRNCEQIGHMKKDCPEAIVELEKPQIVCNNCNNPGHYLRDCIEPRVSKSSGCRNCGGDGHRAAECTEPRDASGVQCNHCQEMGHFSKECPSKPAQQCRNCLEEGHRAAECTNERVVQCRNCDIMGHFSKECTEPRNWDRVKCRNCNEMGHGAGRCPNPPAEEAAEMDPVEADYAPVAASGGWDAGNATESANHVTDEGAWGVATSEEVTAW